MSDESRPSRRGSAVGIAILILLALATGLLSPIQAGCNARLARDGTGSTVLAAMTNTAVGTAVLGLIAVGLWAAGRLHLPSGSDLEHAPWWGWTGGVFGCLYVLGLSYLVPRLGVAPAIGLVVCAHLIMSLLIDQFGWLGLERRPADLARLGGAALLVAGAGLMQWPRSVEADPPAVRDGAPALRREFTLDGPTVGVSVSPDGRVFVVPARIDGSEGPRMAERVGGTLRPYPDAAWNAWGPGRDSATCLVRVNAQRVGPDGDLWLVDVGSPGFAQPTVPGGPKLVRIDLARDAVRRSYPLAAMTRPDSYVDDVRFHGHLAYLTDAGTPGLIVLDLDTGAGRRVLEGHPSVTAARPNSAEGKQLADPDGKPVFVHADQLEVSPDGRYLYFQACCGPLHRVETRLLDDPALDPAELAAGVEKFADLRTTGGTAIDAAGNIFASDTDHNRILKITPSGAVSTLVEDPRLVWVDAMWVDAAGRLWLPASQLNRLAVFNGGRPAMQPPIEVFTITIGAGPPANDHR